jgi:hypothetical protein
VGTNGTFPGFSAVETPSYLPAPLSTGFLSSLQTCSPFPSYLGVVSWVEFLRRVAAVAIRRDCSCVPTLLEYKAEAAAGVFVSVSGRSAQIQLLIHPSSKR